MPDAHQRDQHLAAWFRVVVDALLEHEETYCTDDAAGAALWVPPDVAPLTEEQGERLGAVTADMGDVGLDRLAALSEMMEANHPHDPHLYLWFAGVHADPSGPRVGRSAPGVAAGAGRRAGRPRLPRGDQRAEPRAVRAARLRGHRRALRRRVADDVADVAGPPLARHRPRWSERRKGPVTHLWVTGLHFSVREGGVEPPRPFGHTDLNRARLPIPPLALEACSG